MHAVRFAVLLAVAQALTLQGADAPKAPPADTKAPAPAVAPSVPATPATPATPTAPAAPRIVVPAPAAPATPGAVPNPANERMKPPAKAKELLPPPMPVKDRPAPRTADEKSLAVIDAYIKAVGGAPAFAAIQDRYERFNVIRHSPTGETKAVFERYLKRNNMVREDWHLDVAVGDTPKLDVIQTYNSKTGLGWTRMMGYVSPLDAKMIYMLVWDKYIDDSFMSWKEDGYALKYRSEEGLVDKRPCHVLDVFPPAGGTEARYFFDKENGLLLKKQWRTDSPDGPVRSELFFGEYRKIKDLKDANRTIMFPFRQDQQEDGDLVMTREYVELKLNSGIADDVFNQPEGTIFEGPVGQNGKKEDEGTKKKGEVKAPWLKDGKRIVPKGSAEGAPKAPTVPAPATPAPTTPTAPVVPAPPAPPAPPVVPPAPPAPQPEKK